MYAVSGASGQLGRLVVKHLLTLVPARQIIATTRNPAGLEDLAAQGVVVRKADFSNPASLQAAFEGVTRLLIISTDVVGQRVDLHKTAIEAAARARVSHIVYTSAIGAEPTSAEIIQREHGLTEAALAASGVKWTALRNSYYAEVLPSLIDILQDGSQVHLPEGQAKVNWVTREDCARTAAFVLAGKSDLEGPADVTGPEAVSLAEVVQRRSSISGRVTTIVVSPDKELLALAVAKGLPEPVANLMVGIAIWANRVGYAAVADTVERTTGTRPTPIDAVFTLATA